MWKLKHKKKLEVKNYESYSGECVAGVRDEHAGLSNSTITNCDTLNEPGCAHVWAMLDLPLPHPCKLLFVCLFEFEIWIVREGEVA